MMQAGIGQMFGQAMDIAGSSIKGDIEEVRNNRMSKAAMEREKQMAQYYYDLSMKKWNDTGYGAQKKQMEEAGLNPGLMYGMGGGAQGQSNATTPNDQKGMELGQQMQGMNLAMQQAQIENINEETRAKRIENKREEDIGDRRKRSQEDLEWKRADAELEQIFNSFNEDGLSKGDEMELWKYEVAEVEKEIAKRENNVQNETERERIGKIKYDYFNSIVEKELKEAKIDLTREEERKIWHDIWQGWTNAGLKGLDTIVKGRLGSIGKGTQEAPKVNKYAPAGSKPARTGSHRKL